MNRKRLAGLGGRGGGRGRNRGRCIQTNLGTRIPNSSSITVASLDGLASHTCSADVSATTLSGSSNSCSFPYPTGTAVQLTGTTLRAPMWGGACAGTTGTVCSVTLTGSDVSVSLDYSIE